MTDKILDEYVRVTRAIENIQDKINRYKNNVISTIESSTSEHEQEQKLREFRNVMEKIKSDPSITEKYRSLKKTQEELRKILLPVEESKIDQAISDLKSKYEYLSKKKVIFIDDKNEKYVDMSAQRSIQKIKFDMVLNQIEKNLNEHEKINNHESYKLFNE